MTTTPNCQTIDEPWLTDALERCVSEPLHHIGTIQSVGVLLAVDSEHFVIRSASANLGTIFPVTAEAALGKPLVNFIGSTQLERLQNLVSQQNWHNTRVWSVLLPWAGIQVHYDAHIFRADDLFVIEIEQQQPDSNDVFHDLFIPIRDVLWKLDAESDLDAYAQQTVAQVRLLTGFDRVMMYRFAPNWDGEVIAESKVDTADSYLGNHFPAADIPAQARALYTRNLVRIIADVNAEQVPILGSGDELPPLDLTHSWLRSMSPVHREYLRNMGVCASMSISLVQNEQLWGLIACHHFHPKYVSLRAREFNELIGRAVSLKLIHMDRSEREGLNQRIQELLYIMNECIRSNEALDFAMHAIRDKLLDLVRAEGAVVAIDGKWHILGNVPTDSNLARLVAALRQQPVMPVFYTDSTTTLFADIECDHAGGFLVAPVDQKMVNFVMWFRPCILRTIRWAGNPQKNLTYDTAGPRLSPRKSFATWIETYHNKSRPWLQTEVDAAAALSLALIGVLRLAKALKESNLRLQMALDAGEVAIHEWDITNDQLIWDDRLYDFWGLPPGTPMNPDLFAQGIHPEDRERVFGDVNRLMSVAQGESQRIQYRVVNIKTGAVRWLELYGQMLFHEGNPVRFLGTAMDITHRKHAERIQRLNEQRLDALFELNRQAAHLTEEQLLRTGLEDAERLTESQIAYLHFINDDQRTISLGFWSAATLTHCTAVTAHHYPLEQAGIWVDSIRYRKPFIHNDYQKLVLGTQRRGYPEGHTHLIRHMSVPVIENDKVIMIIGVGNKATLYDETDLRQLHLIAEGLWHIINRRRIEIALAEGEARFKSVADSSPLAIFISKLEGNVHNAIYINPTFINLFGYTLEDVPTADHWYRCAYPDAAYREQLVTEWLNRVTHAVATQSNIEPMEAIATCKDGSRKNILWGLKSFGEMNWAYGLDLTERRQAEADLLRATRAAEAANHAKSIFLANMSHEIRTPMNAVLGFLQLLKRTPVTKQQRDYLDKASVSAESLLCILNDILDFSKVEAGKLSLDLQPFSLRRLIERLMNILASAVAQKQIQLRFEIPDNLPAQVVGDSLRLQQVLLNLTSNAVKFTEQGEVVLGMKVHDYNVDSVRLEFWVKDTGIGIAADKLATIFQEFSQAESSTTRRFGGTGLGLTISQRLIEMMGGSLKVTSTLGVGSRFFFVLELPCSDVGITEINETVDVSGNNQPLAQLRLMLVEDNPLNQQVARELLEYLGATIQVANNGQEAVQMWTRTPAAFDEILMDVQMPVMDGHEATRLLRAQGCTIPIIAMTANALLSDQEECLAAGMNDHVGKPFDIHQMVATLLRHSGRREQPVILESTPATTPPQEPLLDAPGFDFNAALARLGNRMPTYLTLVRQFMYDQQAIMERLRHDQNVNAAREIHTLKGIAGAVGAIELAQWLADTEQQVKMQGINSAMLNILESKMAATIQILEQLLARLEIKSTPSVSVDLRKYLERLAPLLQASNLEALDVWEELLQAHGQKLAPQLASLNAAMKEMNFAAAYDLCREIKQR